MTPSSSFSRHDRQKPKTGGAHLVHNNFDLAKLLDPFEQLEREFNWKKEAAAAAAVALASPIKPPSEFGSFSSSATEEQVQQSGKLSKNNSVYSGSVSSDVLNVSETCVDSSNVIVSSEKCNNIDIYDVMPNNRHKTSSVDEEDTNESLR